jgi:hypothetical protein
MSISFYIPTKFGNLSLLSILLKVFNSQSRYMEINYANIQPIILEEKVANNSIFCKFKTADLDEIVEASAFIEQANDLGSQAQNAVKDTIKRNLWYSLSSAVYRMFGGGMLGSVASDVATAASQQASDAYSFSQIEKQNAVVEAFKSVAHKFYWDEQKYKWILVRQIPDFVRQTIEYPVNNAYDKEILARILVELAKIDGKIVEEEKDYLNAFLPENIGTLEEFIEKPFLTQAEFAHVSLEAKGTILMLAWGVSLIDEDLAESERNKLEEYRLLLGLDEETADTLKKKAQFYILENLMLHLSPTQLYEWGNHIDMTQEDVDVALMELRKRRMG